MNNGNFKYLVTPSERRLMMLQARHKPPAFDDWRCVGSTSTPLGYTTTSDMLQITILRHSTLKHKNAWIPSHRAPQKLSIRSFDSKFNSLSFGLAKSPLYDILQSNTKTAEYRATEHSRSSRSDRSMANSILYLDCRGLLTCIECPVWLWRISDWPWVSKLYPSDCRDFLNGIECQQFLPACL